MCPPRYAPKRASPSPQSGFARIGNTAVGRAAARSLTSSAICPAAWNVGASGMSAAMDSRPRTRCGGIEAGERSVRDMPQLHLLRVFCADDGSGGNALGVFLHGADVPPERRQAVAADLGLSETVFVDDAERGAIRIFTPAVELDFAGHPTVGAAWLLEGADVLRVAAGALPVRRDGELVYVSARPEWGPPHEFAKLGSPDEVDALEGPPGGHDLLTVWSWIDESAGVVRARAFLERLGIVEDEATGSA